MKRNTYPVRHLGLLVPVIILLASIGALGSLDLTVRDNSLGDDIAHVFLFYPDSSQQDLGYTPPGLTGRTWDLLTQSQILTKGPGNYRLRIIHDADTTDDICNTTEEVLGTYTITFGGGVVVSTINDSGAATGGLSTTIDVLANDLLVDASSFSFGTIPCPLTEPGDDCTSWYYDFDGAPWTTPGTPDTQCPSGLILGVNYVEGSFDVTVGDASLDISSVSNPPHGTATIVGSDVRYTPDPGFCGIDTFTYTAERSGMTGTGTVTVNVSAAVPTPQDDLATTPEGIAIIIDVLSNDSTAGGGALTLNSVGNPSYGMVTIIGDTVRYTPQTRFEGNDRFSYRARNVCGETATAWVDVSVLHTNHPPEANAGMMYQGVVNEPLVLDASFSHDPDIEDTLQYRWDLNGSGIANTGWLSTPRYTATYSTPFFGQIILEVRDVYRGIPTGEISQAAALVRIASLQSIQVLVFEDLNGNGVRDDGEPGLPGIGFTIGGETMTTEADGGISVELDAGHWDIAMTPQSVSNLESRGFAVTQTEAAVELAEGGIEIVALGVVKTSTKVTGFVYADLNENGEFDEDIDQLLQGLRVALDEDRETLTDDAGRFYFLGVLFAEHILWIGENVEGAEGNDGEDILALFVPISLERGTATEFSVLWLWPPVGSEQGFLNVEVEKSGN
jgi:hypothetical protein